MVLSGLSSSLLSRFPARVLLRAQYFSMASKPMVIFVLGGPGAGKGTQCANIVRVSSSTILQVP